MGKECVCTAMSRQHVTELCCSFQSGRQDAESRNMTGSGRPSSSMTEITTARIGEMIQSYRWATLREISSELGMSMDILGLNKKEVSPKCLGGPPVDRGRLKFHPGSTPSSEMSLSGSYRGFLMRC
ncbi:hypothetical protein TNCV_72511 [Trichonephila clavipes]|uniref:Uncharacterized protein n=1 Tax=Trichonephila clavipes TaxID=2585209 RepID=A0A8X6R6Z3_TRICX|nr:hypothetical protein TNCV_72511 [Trichonephila clavipes]